MTLSKIQINYIEAELARYKLMKIIILIKQQAAGNKTLEIPRPSSGLVRLDKSSFHILDYNEKKVRYNSY